MNTPSATWQQALADAFDSVADLCAYLQLSPADLSLPRQATAFPLRVPRDFAARMQAGNPNDPLLRQVLPDLAELNDYPATPTTRSAICKPWPKPALSTNTTAGFC
ncbi:hypothetical protein [Methylomonas koyamae]|uniref:hypothetical protein n=1 Tax=Methylomonas koyamae TaxID=702114 RepID=UPI000B300EFA|nr:hypothetical protein [Methylomonas koyamae]